MKGLIVAAVGLALVVGIVAGSMLHNPSEASAQPTSTPAPTSTPVPTNTPGPTTVGGRACYTNWN